MTQRRSVLALALLLLAAALPQLASAQGAKGVQVPGPGHSMIGNFRWATNPDQFQHQYYFQGPDGSCHFTSLGDSNSITFETTIQGTQWNDNIVVATTQTTFCGLLVLPTVLNGHMLRINGGAGNDTIVGGGTTMRGDAGVDYIVAAPGFTGDIRGGDQNDKLWPANNVFVYGGNHDDRMCVQTASDYVLGSGDSGADQHYEAGSGFILSSTLVSSDLWSFLCF
jgi:Ca2+-binding RTX toxin-like protein